MKRIVSIFAITFFAAGFAKAGLLLEPYLGYGMTTTKSDFTALAGGANNDSKTNGLGYGARVGFKSPAMFWVAADAQMASGDVEYDKAGKTSDKGTITRYGLDVGFDLPMVRFWAGYNFQDQVEVEYAPANGTGKDKFTGTGYKVGVGYHGLPVVSINAEYIYSKYTKATGVDFGTFTFDDLLSKLEGSTIMISVSAPFNLL